MMRRQLFQRGSAYLAEMTRIPEKQTPTKFAGILFSPKK